jgi:hypothetical protein
MFYSDGRKVFTKCVSAGGKVCASGVICRAGLISSCQGYGDKGRDFVSADGTRLCSPSKE